MASSTTTLLFQLLFICLALDMVTRYFDKPPIKGLTNKAQKEKENKYENPLKDVEIDTSLDEDDDNFVDTNKKKSKKKLKNETEEDSENEEEKEKEVKKAKKHKKTKKTKHIEDDEEEEDREILTIIYDKKSFQKYCENLKNQIMGNFTSLDVDEKEYPLPSFKKTFSKFTFFTQMGVSVFIFAGQKFKDKLTMIPSVVFDAAEKNKWVIMIGNFLFHQWLNKYLSTTGAFEVYYKDRLIFSKLSSNRLPTEADIHRILRKSVKSKKKKSKKVEEDDDNEDL